MNESLQRFARDTILNGLRQLPEGHQMVFKRMYSHKNLELSIEDVVEKMDESKLDWAMQQVDNSLKKLAASLGDGRLS
jgi:hypothetical protein